MSRDIVPWITRADVSEGLALSKDQLDSLSAAHDLDRDDLDGLASALTVVLGERRHLGRKELEPERRKRGREEVEKATEEIRRAEALLARSRERLADVSFKHLLPGTGMRNPADDHQCKLAEIQNELRETSKFLEASVRADMVMLKGAADMRRLRDERRRLVCHALFDFWTGSGRRLAYTTNPVTNEREGPLVRFVNDVVRCVTKPPTALDGDGVKTEISGYRSKRGSEKPSGPLRRARDVEAEAAQVLAGLDESVADPAIRFVRLIALRNASARKGNSERRMSDLRLAVLLSEELLARAIDDPAEKGEALKDLAMALTELGEVGWDLDALERAVSTNRQALEVLAGREHRTAWAGAQLNLGFTLQRLEALRGDSGPTPERLAAYDAALTVLDPVKDSQLLAHVRMSFGVALAQMGDATALEDAERHLRAALDVAGPQGDARQRSNIHNNMAMCLLRKASFTDDPADLDEAARQANDAISILRDLDEPQLMAMAETLKREIADRRSWHCSEP